MGDAVRGEHLFTLQRVAAGAASTPSPARSSALINALIEELPDPGSAFAPARREAWLELMSKAFTMVYGEEGEPMASRPARPAAAARSAPVKLSKPSKAKSSSKRKAKPLTGGPAFYVGKDHIARKRGGDRIMPDDVADMLVDQRGAGGDIMKIEWADGSVGIPRGKQIDITIADVSE